MCAIALGCNPVVAHDPVWTVTDDAPFVAWKSKIGSDAGTPILAGEQILIGTNNAFPRDGRTKDECGVLLSFSRKEGDFLWQLTHAPPTPSQRLADTRYTWAASNRWKAGVLSNQQG